MGEQAKNDSARVKIAETAEQIFETKTVWSRLSGSCKDEPGKLLCLLLHDSNEARFMSQKRLFICLLVVLSTVSAV